MKQAVTLASSSSLCTGRRGRCFLRGFLLPLLLTWLGFTEKNCFQGFNPSDMGSATDKPHPGDPSSVEKAKSWVHYCGEVLHWPQAEVKIKACNVNIILIKSKLSAFDVGQPLLLVGTLEKCSKKILVMSRKPGCTPF